MTDAAKTLDGIRTILQRELETLFLGLKEPHEALVAAYKAIDNYDLRVNEAHEKIEGYGTKIEGAEDAIREWVETGGKGSPTESKRTVRNFKMKIEDEKDLIKTLTEARKVQVENIRKDNGLRWTLSHEFHLGLRGIKLNLEDKFNEYLQLANDLQGVWYEEVVNFTSAKDLTVIHPDLSMGDREEVILLSPRKPKGKVGHWVQGLLNAISSTNLSIDELRAEAEKEKADDEAVAGKLTIKESEVVENE
jgi:hypothetical protein